MRGSERFRTVPISGMRAIAPMVGRGDGEDHLMTNGPHLYDDGRIACDNDGLTIRWYYPWGRRQIPFRRIHSATTFPLRPIRGRRRTTRGET